jgi:hypothetical protein
LLLLLLWAFVLFFVQCLAGSPLEKLLAVFFHCDIYKSCDLLFISYDRYENGLLILYILCIMFVQISFNTADKSEYLRDVSKMLECVNYFMYIFSVYRVTKNGGACSLPPESLLIQSLSPMMKCFKCPAACLCLDGAI